MSDSVWLVGAMYFNRESLDRLDSAFRNTEGYRERLRTLFRVSRPKGDLRDFVIAIGIAATDKAAISFLSSLDVRQVGSGFLITGTLGEFAKCVRRCPRHELSPEIKEILDTF
jgi:hypothetical protein